MKKTKLKTWFIVNTLIVDYQFSRVSRLSRFLFDVSMFLALLLCLSGSALLACITNIAFAAFFKWPKLESRQKFKGFLWISLISSEPNFDIQRRYHFFDFFRNFRVWLENKFVHLCVIHLLFLTLTAEWSIILAIVNW